MLVDFLEKEFDEAILGTDTHDINITGVTCDSRLVKAGFLFAALPGVQANGRQFVNAAIQDGASAVLAPIGSIAREDISVPLIEVKNARKAYAIVASRFHGYQPQNVVLVTGTNGKTSVVNFLRQMWNTLGYRAADIGTLGTQVSGNGFEFKRPGSLTTPDPSELYSTIADLAKYDVDHLAIEASSHGLAQYRLDGLKVKLAAFTNLSRDHLDYHSTEALYLASKRRLFTELLDASGVAILNSDSDIFCDLSTACRERGCSVLGYGESKTDVHLLNIEQRSDTQEITISISGHQMSVKIPLIGRFQISNALCAATIALASGCNADCVMHALSKLRGVRGRLELAGSLPNGAPIYVDYAHTPHALGTMLKSIRPHVSGMLYIVFGCGGDRDVGKRKEMGQVAVNNADRVIVTDDNPRSEDPDVIRKQIMAGCPNARNIGDRAKAICEAVGDLEKGDLLVVAGKGHEQDQKMVDVSLPFDDVTVVREAISKVGSGLVT